MRNLDTSTPAAGSSAPPGPAATHASTGIAGPTIEAKRPAPASRDGLVFLSMAIVAVAIATMFYSHFSLTLAAASLYGAGFWAASMLFHKLVQKTAQIAHLNAELARVRGQNSRPRNAVRLQPATPLETAAATTIDTRAPDVGAVATMSETLPTAMNAPAPEPQFVPPSSQQDAEAASPPPNFLNQIGFGRRRRGQPQSGIIPPSLGAEPEVPPPAASEPTPSQMATMASPVPPIFPTTPPDMAPAQLPERSGDALRNQWSLRPRLDTRATQPDGSIAANPKTERPAASLTIEGDLDLVLRKIKELAEEVNEAEPQRPAPARPPRSEPALKSKADAIDNSIDALKAAATTMRERGLPEYVPAHDNGGMPRPPQAAPLPPSNLGDFVIPSTAKRIAGSADYGPDATAPARREPVWPDLPFSNPPPNTQSSPSAGLESAPMIVTLAPIVTLASHSVGHYEMALRLKTASGTPLDAAEKDLANLDVGVVARLDMARLNRAAALSLRMETRDKDGALLTSFMGSSFASRPFLEAFATTYEARRRIAAQLVPVLSQRSIGAFTPAAWQAVRDMHAFGFRFALEGVTNVTADFGMLSLAGFRFVRLDSRVLLEGAMAGGRFVSADEIRQRIALAGLAVIADGVNEARLQARLLDAGVELGHGSLFGAPREVNLPADANAQRSAA